TFNGNCLARFCLSEALSLARARDAFLRHFGDTDGNCVPSGHEAGNRRSTGAASAGAPYTAGLDRGAGVRPPAWTEFRPYRLKQHFRAEGHLRPPKRPLFAHPDAAVALV